jgi:hypothetical protein
MSDELQVLKLATRLDAAGIAYMVTGSMAMNDYVQPRMTRDVVATIDWPYVDHRAAELSVAALLDQVRT